MQSTETMEKFSKVTTSIFLSHSQNLKGELILPEGDVDDVFAKIMCYMEFEQGSKKIMNDLFSKVYGETFKVELDRMIAEKNLLNNFSPKFHLSSTKLETITKRPMCLIKIDLVMSFDGVKRDNLDSEGHNITSYHQITNLVIEDVKTRLCVFFRGNEWKIAELFFGCIRQKQNSDNSSHYIDRNKSINTGFNTPEMEAYKKTLNSSSPIEEVISVKKSRKKKEETDAAVVVGFVAPETSVEKETTED
jgi:hypothetical protein